MKKIVVKMWLTDVWTNYHIYSSWGYGDFISLSELKKSYVKGTDVVRFRVTNVHVKALLVYITTNNCNAVKRVILQSF